MLGDGRDVEAEAVDEALSEMKIYEEGAGGVALAKQLVVDSRAPSLQPQLSHSPSPTNSTKSTITQFAQGNSIQPVSEGHSIAQVKSEDRSISPTPKQEEYSPSRDFDEDTSTPEPAKMPKSKKASPKFVFGPPPLFGDLEEATPEAVTRFQVITDSIYGGKYMGSADHDAFGCDCREEYKDGVNHACGEDSDCINRLTKIECIDSECNCGPNCQNQRFQRKLWSKVSVIKTEKKGYGLRADTNIHANDMIFEYIGEVINESTFRRRTMQYADEGIKHFYFMSLTKSEFIDATKKGNLGRFCNHSCNPNCYVDKWVVGDKLRMGIFAERDIEAGEELVFNYNVDRYGADPVPCYCGEPNCTGFLGGKTQTERATKLSHTITEALGIDDEDGWDLEVAKRPRKRKTGEADEDYVGTLQPKALGELDVDKIMGSLLQKPEKWIVVKLLDRIIKQASGDERLMLRVVRGHGYKCLKSVLRTYMSEDNHDNNIILQVLDILSKCPRVSKNKIEDANIEPEVQKLVDSEHEDISKESKRLLEEWKKLEIGYRIPRRKAAGPNEATATPEPREFNFEWLKKVDPKKYEEVVAAINPQPKPTIPTGPAVVIPTGPRNNVPQRGPVRAPLPVGPARLRPLPSGWLSATSDDGRTYYYSKAGAVTWQRPTIPAAQATIKQAPGESEAQKRKKAEQQIIDDILREEEGKRLAKKAEQPPVLLDSPEQPRKKEAREEREKREPKWKSMTIEKQMKIWENTLAPVVQYVMNKYHKKLPREDLKKHAKDVSKAIVRSDYKHNRVVDPTVLTRDVEKSAKKYVNDYFAKAVKKRAEYEVRRRAKAEANCGVDGGENAKPKSEGTTPTDTPSESQQKKLEDDEEDVKMKMSDDDDHDVSMGPSNHDGAQDLKRKHDEPHDEDAKRLKEEGDSQSQESFPTPPPPPPPSGAPSAYDESIATATPITPAVMEAPLPPLPSLEEEMAQQAKDAELREAEAALERENEENAVKEAHGDFPIKKDDLVLSIEQHPTNSGMQALHGGAHVNGDGGISRTPTPQPGSNGHKMRSGVAAAFHSKSSTPTAELSAEAEAQVQAALEHTFRRNSETLPTWNPPEQRVEKKWYQ